MNINKAVMKEHEEKTLGEIANLPPHAIQGVSEGDSKLLKEAFGIDTVREMGENKFFKIAHAICILEKMDSEGSR